MSGEPEVYQQARRILLDALEALGEQRSAIVLVGAQAVYLHTGDADIAVAPYTTDADVAIDPARLGASPLIEAAMRGGGFQPGANPGSWIKEDIAFDLMVPAALGGGGRRGADLGVHGRRAARKARGLEGALVDNDAYEVAALAPGDLRRFTILVAGPGALLVASSTRSPSESELPAERRTRTRSTCSGSFARSRLTAWAGGFDSSSRARWPARRPARRSLTSRAC